MRRTAQSIEESKAARTEEEPLPEPKKRKAHPNTLKNLRPPWKKGEIANPTGKNQHDFARELSKAIIEQNADEIYAALLAGLRKGNFYGFQVLSERAYGKLKEKREITGAEGGPMQASIAVRFIKPDGGN